MTNRVLLNSDRMKISMPGFDVLTAGNDNLNFSSDWSGISLLMKGTFVAPTGGMSTLSYGKTFNTLPLITLALTFVYEGAPLYSYLKLTPNNVPYTQFRIYSDRLTYNNIYSEPQAFSYFIWDYNE